MAIGLGRMFGVKLPLNFHSPLRSANIADYWRRWHMTLQRMIYAYVFQPLSLSLIRSTWRIGLEGWSAFAVSVGVPTFLTFVIVGVWHGAGWTFVAFGVMHAIYVSLFEISRERRTQAQRRLRKLGRKLKEPGPARRAAARAVTLVAIVAANVMFRAKTVGAAASIWAGMAGLRGLAGSAIQWDVGGGRHLRRDRCFFPNTQQIMSRFDPACNWKEWKDVGAAADKLRLAAEHGRFDRARRRPVPRRDVHPARAGRLPLFQLLGVTHGPAESLPQNRVRARGRGRLRGRRERAAGRRLPAVAIARRHHPRQFQLDLRTQPFRSGAGRRRLHRAVARESGGQRPAARGQLRAAGTPANVVNFSLPETGRNVNWSIAEQVFAEKRPKLVVLGVIEKPSRFGHSAFKYLARSSDVADPGYLGDINYLADLVYLPFRQMRLFAADWLPGGLGLAKSFDPAHYKGSSVDTTGSVVLPDGRIKNGETPGSHDELVRGVTKLDAGSHPPNSARQPRRRRVRRRAPLRPEDRRARREQRRQGGLPVPALLQRAEPPRRRPGIAALRKFGPVLDAGFLSTRAEWYADYAHLDRDGSNALTDWLADPIARLLVDRPS